MTFAAELLAAAEEIVAETVRLMHERHPDMFDRYGPPGYAKCLEDTAYHVEYLAAALDADDEDEFVAYRRWLDELLLPMGIPRSDIDANLSAMADTLGGRFGDGATSAVAMLTRALDAS